MNYETAFTRLALRVVCIGALLVVLASCISSSVLKNPSYHLAPTDAWKVVFLSAPPDVPFVKLGTIFLTGAPVAPWADVLQKARQAAARMGGDAIVIIVQGESLQGVYQMPGTYHGTTSVTVTQTGTNTAYATGYTQGTWIPGPSIVMYKKNLEATVIRAVATIPPDELPATQASKCNPPKTRFEEFKVANSTPTLLVVIHPNGYVFRLRSVTGEEDFSELRNGAKVNISVICDAPKIVWHGSIRDLAVVQ